MAANNTFAGSLNALFKETYADKIEDLIPDGVKILNAVKFLPKDKQPGNLYHQPVVLGLEHGVTFASSDDAFNLNAPIAGVIKDAQVRGYPLVLRSVLGYTAASRAAQGGTQSFMDATKYLVSNMLRSVTKKLEIEMLYGQMGYAKVASNSTTAVTIQTAEWAPGIWAGAEGMPIEIRDSTGTTSKGEFVVQSVNMETRVITLNADPGALVSGDVIWHKGAYGNEFPGIHKILTTSAGTLFNISVSQYNLFKGNEYSADSAALSFPKLSLAAARGVEKGQDGKLLALVNPRAWSNMLNDQAALRRYDGSYTKEKVEVGSKSIMFHSQNGEIEIQPSIYVKEGYAFLLNEEDWVRVGSQDVSFKRPGQNEEFFRDLENAAGYELRLYTDQALFCMAPGKSTLIKDIDNVT